MAEIVHFQRDLVDGIVLLGLKVDDMQKARSSVSEADSAEGDTVGALRAIGRIFAKHSPRLRKPLVVNVRQKVRALMPQPCFPSLRERVAGGLKGVSSMVLQSEPTPGPAFLVIKLPGVGWGEQWSI